MKTKLLIALLLLPLYASADMNPYEGGVVTETAYAWATKLVAYYRFESTPGFATDSSASGANLTDAGDGAAQDTTTYIEGAAAATFDASSTAQLYLADASLPAGFPGKNTGGNQNFLLTYWVRLPAVTSSYEHISKYYVETDGRSFEVGTVYGTVSNFLVYISATGASADVNFTFTIANGGLNVAANTWYHVGVWHDSTLNKWGIRVRQSGGSVYNYSAAYADGMNLSVPAFCISGRRSSGDTASGQMSGKIDKVAIYSWADGANPSEGQILTQIDTIATGGAP